MHALIMLDEAAVFTLLVDWLYWLHIYAVDSHIL